MAKIMQCDCGHVVRGDTDDELVANVQKHAREVHDMEITREQVLAMAQPDRSIQLRRANLSPERSVGQGREHLRR